MTPRLGTVGGRDLLPPGEYMHRWPELKSLEGWVTNVYTSSQVHLPSATHPKQDARLSGPGKVLVDGEPYFFKRWGYSGSTFQGANLRELRAYEQIHEGVKSGRIRRDLRICRLHGIVVDRDDETSLRTNDDDTDKGTGTPQGSRLVGILLTFIETNKPSQTGTLHYRINSGIRSGDLPPETLSRWAHELDACVAELHEAGVVWGDAKPDNILVDADDNIWIVDFGGSYTPNWVDKEKSETVEGDWQGVANIKRFLESKLARVA